LDSQVRLAIVALALSACAKPPEPPPPLPQPEPPSIDPVDFREQLQTLDPPAPLPPRLYWSPSAPGEGTVVALKLDPEPRGMPIFEVQARASDREIVLVGLRGGSYFGLVAAPRATDEVPVQISITLVDGTRLSQRLSLRVTRRSFPSTRLRVASRYTAPDEAILRRVRKEREWVRAALAIRTETPLWRGAFIRPLDGLTTSVYGQRRMFNNEVRSQHTGLDIDGDTGDPVVASNSGRVILSRDLFYSGQAVYVDHGLGFITGYYHLSKREVSEGQWVDKGDVVGLVGATGRVTGSHLHWSVFVQGISLDPLSLGDVGLDELDRHFFAPQTGLMPDAFDLTGQPPTTRNGR
jgi:murein DD-endopeptidase MepM/ murein hydrolase activator NlpD